MATYAIGDVQGCYTQLCDLLDTIAFSHDDYLWFAGDIVNRGPHSLATLRLIHSLRQQVTLVLGNHDLHLLAAINGIDPLKAKDTFQDILTADDGMELCEWLRQQKLLHYAPEKHCVLTHAGIPPQWDLTQARAYAKEVEVVLHSDDAIRLFQHMYGDEPDIWTDDVSGWDRLRLIINYFTRMRFCTPEGRLILHCKSTIGTQPKGYYPWFSIPGRLTKKESILFGHWAALAGQVDEPNVYALDTGCVWGGKLTALRLEDKQFFQV